MVEVIDNFLPSTIFYNLQKIMMSSEFPWFYNDFILAPRNYEKDYQFTHQFVNSDTGYQDYYYLIEPCVKQLRVSNIKRIKANLNTKTIFHNSGGFHIDYPNMLTSIFYINTNNGWTKFKGGDKIKCVENRMVIFDSNIEHSGFSCTNQKRKIVVNFNYGKN
tara:strand:+ start:95 stop:580 length:486 start_codon:yes stop_codon:yes gene_type:complete